MTTTIDLAGARALLGNDLLGPDEVGSVFGTAPIAPPIPYTRAELEAAVELGELLVLHVDRDANGPLTLLRLIERFPAVFDTQLLRKMGYQLKDDWGIELEPLAAVETCTPGWLLVRKGILDQTRNLPFEEQDAELGHYGAPMHAAVRRRTAIEIAYDLILHHAVRGERLLPTTWDWSGSRTIDAGYLNIGGFGPNGIQVLSYSPAVRHGALGVCPVRLPAAP